MHFSQLAGRLTVVLLLLLAAPALGQEAPDDPPAPIAVGEDAPGDDAIATRIRAVYAQLPDLADVTVTSEAGVVRLEGSAPTAAAIEQARDIALRVEGVVAVRNDVTRDAALSTRLAPAVETINDLARGAIAGAPQLLVGLIVLAAFLTLSVLLGRSRSLWRRVAPNPFVADLAARTGQVVLAGLGIILTLMLLDATALLTAALGAAGVLGIAIGFAVRDVLENYLASVLLSLRQPFRPHDHVVIEGHEGRVMRLTSRATILLTLDGNHLRIPNADVFKATILNYTRNPERRLDFEVGVAADDDPAAALAAGTRVMSELDYVLDDPPAGGQIKELGDSTIVIQLWAWIDQRDRDFLKARSAVLAEVKRRLEAEGFTLPEPIYRIRMEERPPIAPARPAAAPERSVPAAPAAVDTARDPSLDRLVSEERSEEADLLAEDGPTE